MSDIVSKPVCFCGKTHNKKETLMIPPLSIGRYNDQLKEFSKEAITEVQEDNITLPEALKRLEMVEMQVARLSQRINSLENKWVK